MNEEVAKETVNLAIRCIKVSGERLASAISNEFKSASQRHKQREKNIFNGHNQIMRGKQTVKQLLDQGQGATSMEIADEGVKEFLRIARKYGVDYAIVKDKEGDPPKYTVFFKAKDVDVITAVLKEYELKQQKKQERGEKPSVREKLKQYKEKMSKSPHRERERRREPER